MAGDLFTPDNDIADKEADIMVQKLSVYIIDHSYGCRTCKMQK